MVEGRTLLDITKGIVPTCSRDGWRDSGVACWRYQICPSMSRARSWYCSALKALLDPAKILFFLAIFVSGMWVANEGSLPLGGVQA